MPYSVQENTNELPKICIVTNLDLSREADIVADTIRLKQQIIGLEQRGISIYIISNRDKVFKLPIINKLANFIAFPFIALRELKKINVHNNIDIIQTSDLLSIFPIYIYNIFNNSPYVIYDLLGFRTLELKANWRNTLKNIILYMLYLLLEVLMLKCVDIFITVNYKHMDLLKLKTNKKIFVVRDGVSSYFFNKYNYGSNEFILQKKPEDVLLVFVGRLANRRLDRLFKIIPLLINESSHINFLIIGSGPNYNHYLSIAKRIGQLDKRIYFAGYLNQLDICRYLQISDIAYSDVWSKIGFPMKVYEYMAAGKAVLIDDTESSREIIQDGINGLLAKDENELKAKLIILCDNKEYRYYLGKNAKFSAKDFSWESHLNKLMNIYINEL